MSRRSRWLVLLLVMIMAFSAKAEVFAKTEEVTQGEITATYVNPLYADVLDASDLWQPDGTGAVMLAEDTDYCTELSEAGAIMRAGMKNRAETIQIYYQAEKCSSTDEILQKLYDVSDRALVHTGDPTEGDYLMWQYGGWQGSISYYNDSSYTYLIMTYTMTYYTTLEQEETVDAAIDSVLNDLDLDGSSDYQKLLTIYDYICSHVSYDYANLEDDDYMLKFTAYGALIDETAVCQGYAVLFYRMALEEGIDARVITGDGGGAHAWNIAEIYNLYYNLDATWDAGHDAYGWFLLSDKNFVNHTRNEEYLTDSFYERYPMGASDYVDHSFSSYVSDGNATCTEDGTKTAKCDDCDATDTVIDVGSALGHQYGYRDNGNGTHTASCTVCGSSYTESHYLTGHTCDDCGGVWLTAPVLSSVSNTADGVAVAWQAVDGAEKYRVYRKTDSSGWKRLGDTTGITYTDTTAVSGTKYTYTVRCLNSEATACISGFDTAGKTVQYIAQPAINGIANGASGITVKWTAVGGAEKYRVYRKTGSSGWVKVGDTASTSYTDTTAVSGTKYTYTVRGFHTGTVVYTSSYDRTGKTLMRLSQPSVTGVTNGGSGMTVKWSKVNGASGYYVYRRTTSGKWARIAAVSGGSTVSYGDTGVKAANGTAYLYTVRAYNGSTLSSYMSGKQYVRLVTPTISSVKNTASKTITVKWNKNTSATGYLIWYQTGSTAKTVTVSGKANVSKVIRSLAKGKTYTVKVRTYKTVSGTNYYSAWSSGKTVKITK